MIASQTSTSTARLLAVALALAAVHGSRTVRGGDEAAPVAEEPAAEVALVPDASGPEPVAFDGEMLLEPAATADVTAPPAAEPIAVPEGLLADGAVVDTPQLTAISAGPGGMLLDDSALDEMPFEASSGRWFWNGGWYVGGESLWMDRSRNNRRIIAADIGTRDTTYTSFAQPFNVAPGARATIGKSLGRDYLDRDRFFEFIYYGGMAYEDTDGWNSVFPNSLYTPLDYRAAGFNGAGSYTVALNSDFNSWEWNYKLRRRLGRDQLVLSPNGEWTRHAERGWLPALILGPRLATVNEDYSFTSARPGVATDTFGGRYVINTSNWLLGLNLGGELVSQNEFYYWGLRGRAAPALSFANASQSAVGVNTTQTGPRGTTNFSDEASRTGAGFIGDLTLFAGWQITPNFSLQAGYDFLWVAGMATATRQFNLDDRDNDAIDAGGQTFYNGVSFGFYGSW